MKNWQRLEFQGRAVYVHPEKPDWFIPNVKADHLLQDFKYDGNSSNGGCTANLLALGRLYSQINIVEPPLYKGRGKLLNLSALKECWFHLTSECNLSCRHCLFSAGPGRKGEFLETELLARGLTEAKELGCRVFYFTGGEPFVYPDFLAIITELLDDPELHVVVLTNGLLLSAEMEALKMLPRQRFHLQISMDGLRQNHEYLRGSGTFDHLLMSLKVVRELDLPVTLSVAVNRTNLSDLPAIIAFAAVQKVKNIHFLWHFVRGKGTSEQFVAPAEILPWLIKAQEAATAHDILIDNVETIKKQLFSAVSTRHDLANTAWESVAVGPDGNIYPSPALVLVDELNCGRLADGLAKVWRHSPVLEQIRQTSLLDSTLYQQNPLKFIVGGGDIDHSYINGGSFVGHDPYLELYNNLALWLITRQADRYVDRAASGILLKMGDLRYDCPDHNSVVALTHCNCVISLADDDGHRLAREFYAKAAVVANMDIINPYAKEQAEVDYIPAASKKRSYGCGSPVKDAELRSGETVVDLGSGSGVECFMAAAEVGSSGMVYGIDMTDEMLALARASCKEVSARLGYCNVEFKKGFLEDIPLAAATADVVISNCVINLSPDKRLTFHEIYRILKAGGRVVISDIVTDDPIPFAISSNEKLRGECLGGAMRQEEMMAMLCGAGFVNIRLIKRYLYRQVGKFNFYSLTFRGCKPDCSQNVDVIYRGPFAAICTEDGLLLRQGERIRIPLTNLAALDDSVFVLDHQGSVTNMPTESICSFPSLAKKQTPHHDS